MMEQQRDALASWLAERAGAERAEIGSMNKLPGGAIQENWALDISFTAGPLDGSHALVVRTDAPSGVTSSLGRPEEFALFRAAFDAGVTVPEPLWQDAEGEVLGKPLFIMRKVSGVAAGHRLVKEEHPAVAETLGRELARIHTIRPPRADLHFLNEVPACPAIHWIERFRAWLDGYRQARPVLEWGLRWLERHAPETPQATLCHNDFRTGNYMVDGRRVTGILDWEFASWGDPLSDLGWFCAPCWRFGAKARQAGGIGAREDFYRGYEQESGRTIDRGLVTYWEVMATLRWAVIALQQAERHVSGAEDNLELALTAHIVPELELDILEMTREQADA